MKAVVNINKINEKDFMIHCDNYGSLKQFDALDFEKMYSIELKPVLSKRSIEHNTYFWALLHDISTVQNEGRPGNEWDVYIDVLKLANVKYELIIVLPEAEYMLNDFRAKEFIKEQEVNGVTMNVWKCYTGSSKMNSKEFNLLVETALDYAAKVGCDMSYWENIFE